MNQPSDQFIRNWGQVRNQGRLRYIMLRGMLIYGGLAAVIFVLLNAAWANIQNDRSILDAAGLEIADATYLLLTFVIMVVAAGYAWGAFTWRHNEKTYLKFVRGRGE